MCNGNIIMVESKIMPLAGFKPDLLTYYRVGFFFSTVKWFLCTVTALYYHPYIDSVCGFYESVDVQWNHIYGLKQNPASNGIQTWTANLAV